MTETGDGTAQAKLDAEFLRGFSARWHAAWNSHDHHQVAALCTNDVEWHDPSLPGPGHGAGVIAGLMETLVRACPDFRFGETEPAYPSLTRPKAIAPWRFTGTMTGPLIPPGSPRPAAAWSSTATITGTSGASSSAAARRYMTSMASASSSGRSQHREAAGHDSPCCSSVWRLDGFGARPLDDRDLASAAREAL